MSARNDELAIRPFADEDRETVKRLWRRCGLTMPYNDPDHDIDLARAKPGSDCLVGVWEEVVVASVMVGHDGHRGWLYYVAVDPDHRGNGFGAAIVRTAEAWLAARGIPKALLMIRDTNAAARGFYEAAGWEAIPRIVMEKWLKPL